MADNLPVADIEKQDRNKEKNIVSTWGGKKLDDGKLVGTPVEEDKKTVGNWK
jgi:hypothetical protein